ncbi:Eukaryotic translation initiation factor 2A [Symbiodinium microadriaticum]|uniref:Eukaryotic translation initiation factor 2A n=1 Tax=Symbiodinium microadriaticum TaxID=2951 RepID=A0A1Q9CVN4_SYMMI|nr:Eukaryotic translation initiation factor 2A [Symbiodinium microadriaticum]
MIWSRSERNKYSFQPGDTVPNQPEKSFPAVNTAEGCEWSSDGSLLGLVDPAGGVTVYSAAQGYEPVCQVPPLVGGPVRNFYFSPLGTHLVTYERWVKDAGDNVGVWDAKTGEKRFSFILKNMTGMTWPPLKWTSLETHCCRMVQDGVQILPGSCERSEVTRIDAPGIMAFEVSPRGSGPQGSGSPHVALVVAETKGQPARCQVYKLDDPSRATATKNFFKAETVTMKWNNVGTAVLVKSAMEVDDTGKSYYGGANLYFLRADGEESALVASADGGPIHDAQWSPTQDEFILLHGELPCPAGLYEGRKGNKRVDFGSGHRNTIRWNPFGRFFVLGGYGQLLGDTDFWDKPGKQLMASRRMECCVVCGWAPDGRHFLTATTAPRMRVDNKIELFDYLGAPLGKLEFDELLLAGWRPRPRGAFQDRAPSPGRSAPASQAKAAAKPKAAQAYRPPGARAGGGLADLLRKELGSTSAGAATTATKVGAPTAAPISLPPGASAEDFQKGNQGGTGSGSSRNARKKKAKEAAAQAAPEPDVEKFVPPPRTGDAKPAPSAGTAAESQEAVGGDEVEKKVRALRKKLRDIEKLKEKVATGAPIDPLQKQKIDGEAELIQQIRSLGAAKIIRSRSRLQHLDLRHNRIGDVGSKRLSKAIKGHHSLVQLDLQDNAVAIAGAESLFAACGKRLELNMQNNPVPPEKITQLVATLKEAREKLHLTAFGGGTPGSAKGTLRPPRSREGREGGGRSPARSPAPSAARSPALSTAQSPARSRASSFLPGISKEEIG